MNVLAEYVILPIQSIISDDVDVSLKLIIWWPQYYWKPNRCNFVQGIIILIAVNTTTWHLPLLRAGWGGVILLVLGQSGSAHPGAGGARVTCVCLRLKNYTWLTGSGDSRCCHLRSKMSQILRGSQSSLVTFLLASSEIQDNKQRQTVVVQCSPLVPMWHVTHVCYAQSKLTNYCNFQEVCPPQPQSDLSQVWPEPHPLSEEQ